MTSVPESAGDDEELPDIADRDWRWAEWAASDSVRHFADGHTEEKPGGWDHDHCLQCSARISRTESGLRFAYTDANDEWLCPSCYKTFVTPDRARPGAVPAEESGDFSR